MGVDKSFWTNIISSSKEIEYTVISSVEGIADFNRMVLRDSLNAQLNDLKQKSKIKPFYYRRLRRMANSKSVKDLYLVELIIEQIKNEPDIQRKGT